MCKFFKIPPNSKILKSLTLQEKIWLLSNIYKDDQEEMEKLQMLVKFIRPEAFFNKKEGVETADFIESIEEKLGRKLTEEELSRIEDPSADENIDVIEHVE